MEYPWGVGVSLWSCANSQKRIKWKICSCRILRYLASRALFLRIYLKQLTMIALSSRIPESDHWRGWTEVLSLSILGSCLGIFISEIREIINSNSVFFLFTVPINLFVYYPIACKLMCICNDSYLKVERFTGALSIEQDDGGTARTFEHTYWKFRFWYWYQSVKWARPVKHLPDNSTPAIKRSSTRSFFRYRAIREWACYSGRMKDYGRDRTRYIASWNSFCLFLEKYKKKFDVSVNRLAKN